MHYPFVRTCFLFSKLMLALEGKRNISVSAEAFTFIPRECCVIRIFMTRVGEKIRCCIVVHLRLRPDVYTIFLNFPKLNFICAPLSFTYPPILRAYDFCVSLFIYFLFDFRHGKSCAWPHHNGMSKGNRLSVSFVLNLRTRWRWMSQLYVPGKETPVLLPLEAGCALESIEMLWGKRKISLVPAGI